MIGFILYIFCLIFAPVGSIYLMVYFLSKKEFLKFFMVVLICLSVGQISYGFGVKSVDTRSENSYFRPTKKLLNHFVDLITENNLNELEMKIKWIDEQIDNKHWRDNSSYERAVEKVINNNSKSL